MTYIDHVRALASLETFQSEAFLPSADASREECGFFLALAAIHNDLKNLVLAQVLLGEVPPKDPALPSTHRGQHGGLETHLLRILVGILYELLELIREHPAVLKGDLFKEVYRLCPKDGKSAWDAVVEAANGHMSTDPLNRALFFVRNKVVFHYDAKELLAGYVAAFSQERYGPPMISRGNNMQESRFYFADAAAQQYFLSRTGADGPAATFGWSTPFSNQVNHALHWLVLTFIAKRGFAFREYRSPT
jgi:hypothetical protein